MDAATEDGEFGGGVTGPGVVFNVPQSEPFLRALARAVLNGDLPRAGGGRPQPEDLPDTTILLPTRRATRALQEHFLDLSGGRAMLLPRIRAIAEANEDLSLIGALMAGGDLAIEGVPRPGAATLRFEGGAAASRPGA